MIGKSLKRQILNVHVALHGTERSGRLFAIGGGGLGVVSGVVGIGVVTVVFGLFNDFPEKFKSLGFKFSLLRNISYRVYNSN